MDRRWRRGGDSDGFGHARVGWTVFGNVYLAAYGLDAVSHIGPSTIGIDTLYRSEGNIPEVFLPRLWHSRAVSYIRSIARRKSHRVLLVFHQLLKQEPG